VEIRSGWRVVCHPTAWEWGYSDYKYGDESAKELDAFILNCWPGMTLFDVGAHFGIFTLAGLHYGAREVIALEPSPAARRILELQLRLNHAAGRARVVAAAASAACGSLPLLSTGVGGNMHFLPADSDHPVRDFTVVPAVTIDSLASDFRIMPTHLKIDVEGQEGAVLQGARCALAESCRVVALELHNQMIRQRGENPEEVLGLLKESEFQIMGNDQPGAPGILLNSPLVRIIARKPEARV
jgi:FkbM family methyltransferase